MAALNDNIAFGYLNHFQTGAVTVTGGSTVVNYDYGNMLDTDLATFTGFVNSDQTQNYFEANFGAPKVFQVAALLKHNLTQYARWRVRLATTQANLVAAPLHDSGWLSAFPAAAGFGLLPWGEFLWGDMAPKITQGPNSHSVYFLSSDVSAQWMRVDIEDPDQPTTIVTSDYSTTVDPYIYFARMFAGPIFQPEFNVPYGAQVYFTDSTNSSVSEAGVRSYSSQKVKKRALSFQINALKQQDMYYYIANNIYMKLGVSGEILAVLQPTKPENYAFEAVYGNLKETSGMTHSVWNRMDTDMYVEEAL